MNFKTSRIGHDRRQRLTPAHSPRRPSIPGASAPWTALAVGLLALVCVGFQVITARTASAAELVMFQEHGCYWCERWDTEIGVVYARTDEGQRAPLRRVDIHDTRPADLKSVERLNFTPTFVLMDQGVEVGRITGYPGEDFFWPLLSRIMEKLPDQPPAGPSPAKPNVMAPTPIGFDIGTEEKAPRR